MDTFHLVLPSQVTFFITTSQPTVSKPEHRSSLFCLTRSAITVITTKERVQYFEKRNLKAHVYCIYIAYTFDIKSSKKSTQSFLKHLAKETKLKLNPKTHTAVLSRVTVFKATTHRWESVFP